MANMSYCRFEITQSDLRDCFDNMDERDLSYDEAQARRTLITMCAMIADKYRYELDEKFPSRAEYEAGK